MNRTRRGRRDHPPYGRPSAQACGPLACPWIDFDRQLPATSVPAIAAGDGPGLDSVLERLFRDAGQRAAIVLRAGAAGLFPIATGPWLAWLSLDFLDRMNGPRPKPLPVSIGRYSYRTGFVARRSAEDLASALVHGAAML